MKLHCVGCRQWFEQLLNKCVHVFLAWLGTLLFVVTMYLLSFGIITAAPSQSEITTS